jgi:transposase
MQKKTSHPEWAIKCRRPGTELRCLRGRYYLYEVSCFYDKEKKKPRKKTGKLLGKVTESEGFVESEKYKLARLAKKMVVPDLFSNISVKEHGLSLFMLEELKFITEPLKETFPSAWGRIFSLAYCRLAHQSALKNMSYHLGRSWLGHELKLSNWKARDISLFLRDIGRSRELAVNYMRRFVNEGDFILADATEILCKSARITLARRGYNSHMDYQGQIGLLYLYSSQSRLPVYYRVIPGNLREVKAFKQCIMESRAQNVVAIADKGFYSKQNIEMMTKENIRYIIPLRRDSSQIDYSIMDRGLVKNGDNYFLYGKRVVWHYELPATEHRAILFLDDKLKLEEETDYILRITSCPEEHSIDDFHRKKSRFGTMTIATNLEGSPEKIYTAYKSRMSIEIMFDGLKNVLDADSSYMQNEEALQGWMFINHIALQIYHSIYTRLFENDMLNKYSVSDIIMMLSDIRKAKINGSWITCEITKPVLATLGKLGFHIT